MNSDELPAGEFSAWLRRTRSAQVEKSAVDVPCGGCTACCRSSYFVHIGPEETRTLARIPKELLFPAPGEPKGHVLMGYDEKGHCPMLVDDKCSIYADRPRTCRNYDCRVFPATGLSAADEDKPLIAQQALRWSFDYASESGREQHSAVQATAGFLREHADAFGGAVPRNSTQLAILAVQVYDVFLKQAADAQPSAELIQAVSEANPRFEAGTGSPRS